MGGQPNQKSPYYFDKPGEIVQAPDSIELQRTLLKRFNVVMTGSEGPVADACRKLESVVFSGVFCDHREIMIDEYAAFEDKSRFFAAFDAKSDNQLAGCIRIMSGEQPADFKAIVDSVGSDVTTKAIREHHPDFNPASTWEIGTVIGAEQYRGRKFPEVPIVQKVAGLKVSAILYHYLYDQARCEGIEHWVTMVDVNVLEHMRSFGMNFVPLCNLPSVEYMGSFAQPSYLKVENIRPGISDISKLNEKVLCDGLGITALSRLEKIEP